MFSLRKKPNELPFSHTLPPHRLKNPPNDEVTSFGPLRSTYPTQSGVVGEAEGGSQGGSCRVRPWLSDVKDLGRVGPDTLTRAKPSPIHLRREDMDETGVRSNGDPQNSKKTPSTRLRRSTGRRPVIGGLTGTPDIVHVTLGRWSTPSTVEDK